jgi:hypothetical protein
MKSKLLLFILLFSQILSAQNTARSLTAKNGEVITYYQYNPVPAIGVIIQFHGNGECGDGTAGAGGLQKLDNIALTGIINKRIFIEPFIVIAPQLNTKYCKEWPLWYMTEIINYAKSFNLPIFISGYSLGGGAVWTGLSDSAICSVISGAVPICGTATFTTAKWVNKFNVPVWAYHGEKDATIGWGNTVSYVAQIPAAKKTYYKGMGHSIWDIVYNQDQGSYATTDEWGRTGTTTNDPTIYKWFASLKAVVPPPVVVVPPARTIIAKLFVNGWEVIVYSDKTSEVK